MSSKSIVLLLLPVLVITLSCKRNIKRTETEPHAYLTVVNHAAGTSSYTPDTAHTRIQFSKAFWTYMAQHYQQTMKLFLSSYQDPKSRIGETELWGRDRDYEEIGKELELRLPTRIDAGEQKQPEWDGYFMLPYPKGYVPKVKPYTTPLQPLTDEIADEYEQFRKDFLTGNEKSRPYSFVFDTGFYEQYSDALLPYVPIKDTASHWGRRINR